MSDYLNDKAMNSNDVIFALASGLAGSINGIIAELKTERQKNVEILSRAERFANSINSLQTIASIIDALKSASAWQAERLQLKEIGLSADFYDKEKHEQLIDLEQALINIKKTYLTQISQDASSKQKIFEQSFIKGDHKKLIKNLDILLGSITKERQMIAKATKPITKKLSEPSPRTIVRQDASIEMDTILARFAKAKGVKKEYDKLKDFFSTETSARKGQIVMLQDVMDELNVSHMKSAQKAAVLRCILDGLAQQLDPSKPHNKDSKLMQLVKSLQAQIGDIVSDGDRVEFVKFFEKNSKLKANKECSKLFTITNQTKNVHLVEQALSSQSIEQSSRAQQHIGQELGFHALYGEGVEKRFKMEGSKWHTSSDRPDQFKFLNELIKTTAAMKGAQEGRGIGGMKQGKAAIGLNQTQIQILQGGIFFIREQLGKKPSGRLATVLLDMENSLKSSVSEGRVCFDPEICKGALYSHLQKQHDKPTYDKAMTAQLDRLEKEVTHRGERRKQPANNPQIQELQSRVTQRKLHSDDVEASHDKFPPPPPKRSPPTQQSKHF